MESTDSPPPDESGSLLGKAAANVTLRVATVASRFLLLISLAAFLPPEQLGVYGIFSASLSLAMFFVGLEFHIFNAREMLSSPAEEWPRLIRDQFILHGVAYVIGAPLLLSLFVLELLPWAFASWFFAIVVLEHALQELCRILVVLSRPLQSSWVSVLRTGAWVYVVLGIGILRPELRGLRLVLACWVGGLVVALALAIYSLRDLAWARVRGASIDLPHLRRGLRVSLPYMISALADRGMYSMDRYVLHWFWGPGAVGVYTFFSGIANSLQIALEAGVVQIFYPSLIAKAGTGRSAAYRTLMRRFARWIVISSLGLALLAAGGIFLVLPFTHNPIYAQHLEVYWVLLLGAVVLALGLIPHYALYALRADRVVTSTRIIGFLVAVIVDLLLIPRYGAVGAALSLVAGLSVSALLNTAALLRREPVEQEKT